MAQLEGQPVRGPQAQGQQHGDTPPGDDVVRACLGCRKIDDEVGHRLGERAVSRVQPVVGRLDDSPLDPAQVRSDPIPVVDAQCAERPPNPVDRSAVRRPRLGCGAGPQSNQRTTGVQDGIGELTELQRRRAARPLDLADQRAAVAYRAAELLLGEPVADAVTT